MSSAPGPFEQDVQAVVAEVQPTDPAAESAAWARLDELTKPPRSLGRLEEVAASVARIQQTVRPCVTRRVVLLMAGDHGVVAEGVSPYPHDVTYQMVANFSAGGAAINQIARSVGAEVRVFDVGVGRPVDLPGIRSHSVALGTRNMAHGQAMTREECAAAMLVGIEAAREAAAEGFALIGTGEMGIGNSTAAAALTAAYTGAAVADVTGPGTGLDAAGVAHKVAVIERALDVNAARGLDPLGVLAAVGGLEIAALAGVVVGGAASGVCVVVDGFISGAAALAAVALCPTARDYVLASHRSAEPGHALLLGHLDARPVLELDMRLGEGTGAALAMGIVDAACKTLSGMATFAEAGVAGAEG